MQMIDKRSFDVGLLKADLDAKRGAKFHACRLDIAQGRVTVYRGLTCAQKVQVGAVKYQNFHVSFPLSPSIRGLGAVERAQNGFTSTACAGRTRRIGGGIWASQAIFALQDNKLQGIADVGVMRGIVQSP